MASETASGVGHPFEWSRLAAAASLCVCVGSEPSPAHAEQPSFTPAPGLAEMRILGVAADDWDRDGEVEFAVLAAPAVDGGVDASLFVYRPDGDGWALVTHAPEIAHGGAFEGTTPFLRPVSSGGFQIVSQNMSVGRNRWVQTLTIVHRDGVYVVESFGYDSYDTLDLDAGSSCDVNLLTGRAIVDGADRRVAQVVRPVALWTAYEWPEVCGTG